MGLLLAVVVTACNLDDGTHAPKVLEKLTPERFPRLKKGYADNKYNNKTLQQWMSRNKIVYEIEINSKPEGEGLEPIRIRWVVEQAHACHGRCRRLSKDYERKTSSSEVWIQLSASRRMIRRLKPDKNNMQAKFKYTNKIKEVA